jgi:hypothetical protein
MCSAQLAVGTPWIRSTALVSAESAGFVKPLDEAIPVGAAHEFGQDRRIASSVLVMDH